MPKISWSDCHVDWSDATTMLSVTHLPTGTVLEVGEDIGDDRDHLLAKLETEILKTHTIDEFGAFSER